MDMALNELAMMVAAPAPVPVPIPAAATIPVALTGWSPSTIAVLETAGVIEVPAEPCELVYCKRQCPRLCSCAPYARRAGPHACACTRRACAHARAYTRHAPFSCIGRHRRLFPRSATSHQPHGTERSSATNLQVW